jgi:16S rRNA (adenine1518-N6/adenine1519-N6)-dimethyltransferase
VAQAKRSLSQNFLVDPNIRRKLVNELSAGADDVVLEVGPGHGELSDLLVDRVAELVLVEKDDSLAEALAARYGARPDVRVVHADALDIDLSREFGENRRRRLISNLPYAVTSPLVFRFLEIRPPPVRSVLLVQREVAERIVAAPGRRTYGALSVGVQVRASARIAFHVGRRAFRPMPKVDSSAVVIEPTVQLEARVAENLRELTRVAFSRRRKQLVTILRRAPEYALSRVAAERVLADVGVPPAARPETLSAAQFLTLSELLRTMQDGRAASGQGMC